MLDLSDVTVCAADTAAPELAARALERCLDRCRFGDAILFSDRPITGRFRNVAIDTLTSLEDYSRFCLAKMAGHITTTYALVVQWDGYVVHPEAWTDEFRSYDYIGAPIPGGGRTTVGNGGFSLRSRKLLDAIAQLPSETGVPEDWVISSTSRALLEGTHGIRFPSLAVADRFSHEARQPPFPSFGFHGAQNMLRYESDRELSAVFAKAAPGTFLTTPFVVLLGRCFKSQRSALGVQLYRQARRHHDTAALANAMARTMAPDQAAANIAVLEQATRRVTAFTRQPM